MTQQNNADPAADISRRCVKSERRARTECQAGCLKWVNDAGDTRILLAARRLGLAEMRTELSAASVCRDHSRLFRFVVDLQNRLGETALLICCLQGAAGGPCAVELLHKWGANPNIPDIDGVTPLHAACACGDAETALALVRHGAFVNQQTEYGDTPLHWCASAGIAGLLIARGALTDIPNEDGVLSGDIEKNGLSKI